MASWPNLNVAVWAKIVLHRPDRPYRFLCFHSLAIAAAHYKHPDWPHPIGFAERDNDLGPARLYFAAAPADAAIRPYIGPATDRHPANSG